MGYAIFICAWNSLSLCLQLKGKTCNIFIYVLKIPSAYLSFFGIWLLTSFELILKPWLCLARPTSAILSVPMSLYCLWNLDFKATMVFQMGVVGINALICQVAIDSALYGGGTTVFPLWNFVKFNFLSDSNKVSFILSV